MRERNTLSFIVRLIAVFLLCSGTLYSQGISKIDRGMATDMLRKVADDIRHNYYDPKFHGLDWDATVAEAERKIANADSMGMAISYIAEAVDTLNDSHTTFYPPEWAHHYDYGLEFQMIGDRCYVTQVRPKSDAEKQGIKVGDEVLTLNGYMPERHMLWKMRYVLHVLRPQPVFQLQLQDPVTGNSRQVTAKVRMKPLKRPTDITLSHRREAEKCRDYLRSSYVEVGDTLIVKLPAFNFANTTVGSIVGKARSRGNLILDLRGNLGGAEKSLKFLVGALFDKDIKIGDRVMREKTEPLIAKTQNSIFTGKLIVLVDSESASASEILARVVQLEKRGTIIGDKTMGSVMESQWHQNKMGGGDAYFYGEYITHADLIMADGRRLEHSGVVPDETRLPTGMDLAKGRDPVLAYAAKLAGVDLSPEDAGKMFEFQWPPDPE